MLARALAERAQVDELAALHPLGLAFGGSTLVCALVVVIATTGGGYEREPQDESKELQAPALSSHSWTS